MSELEWTDEQHDAYQLGMLTEREHQNALSRFAMEKHEDELIALRAASRITDAKLTGDLEMARDRIRELEGQLATLQAATPVGGGEGVFRFDWDAIDPEYEWAVVERYGMYHWQVHAHLYEPHWDKTQGWVSDGDFEHVYIMPDLPLDLDHRTLKQRRPHAQQGTEVQGGS